MYILYEHGEVERREGQRGIDFDHRGRKADYNNHGNE
jgi:hypothetical protein